MKFEKFLNREAVPEWKSKYLDYHLLKDQLRRIPLSSSQSSKSSNKSTELELVFSSTLKLELNKIARFHAHKQSQLLVKYTQHHRQFSKRDLINFYTEVEFLKSYQSLNATALRKIIKKFHKVTGTVEFVVASSPAWKESRLLDQLTRDIEDLFTSKFADGDRHRAMRRLRLRNFRNESFHSAAYFAGLFWGSTTLMVIYTTTITRSSTLYSLAGQFGLFLALGLFSLNTLIFKRSLINYRFVFQFDKRTALHECQLAALSGLLAFTFVATGLIMLRVSNINQWTRLIPLLVTGCVFFNPTSWLWSSARFWMIKRAARIISAPFSSVEFPDFFITDHLISQVAFFQGSINSDNLISKIIMIIPNTTRTLQCLRRYRDTKIRLNILNASKYSLNILVIVMRTVLSSPHWTLDLVQAASSLFSLYWDLVMDFGLMNDRFLLRKQLVIFPYKFVYYYVIIFDSLARFSWLLRYQKILSVNVNLIISFIEIMRRSQWSLLRIEYEHLNNCNSFRAVPETKSDGDEGEGRTADLFYKDMVTEDITSDRGDEEELLIQEDEEEEEEEDTV